MPVTADPRDPWLLEQIRSARRLALMTHVDPDADGLGSQIGFLHAARAAGKDAVIVNDDPCPSRYRWLDEAGDIRDFDTAAANLQGCDLGLCFDANEPGRAGRPLAALQKAGVPVLLVDHHRLAADNPMQGLVATHFSSSGELTFRLIEALGWSLDARAAAGLYAAMSFDTGSFRFLRNNPDTLRVAAALQAVPGLDTNPIQEALFASRPFAETVLLGRILERIERSADGRVAWAVIPPEATDGLDVPRDAVGEAMPFVIGIEGVLAAAMFKPGRVPGQWKLSLRAKAGTVVGDIATRRGGGGHDQAAGATLTGDIESLRAEIVAELQDVVSRSV
ncbi:MAG: hypothetical protein RIT45_2917 [Pseudomonadota bacterium]